MENINFNTVKDSNVTISCDCGSIDIPLCEIVDENELKAIIDDCNNTMELKMELEDLAYEYFTSVMNIEINGL